MNAVQGPDLQGRRMQASQRAMEVAPFHAMAMARAAGEREDAGRRVLHLEVGQPSTPAPVKVRDAAHRALDRGQFGYTNAAGIAPLRRAIAHHVQDWYGTAVDPARVMVVSGASAGFSLAFLAAFGPGDRVGVLEPGYPCYRNALGALGVEAVGIPVDDATRWAPTATLLDAAGPLDGLVVASPSNPTGTVVDLEPIAAYCRERGIRLVSDEIYHGLTFGAPVATASALDPSAVVINSFSKYFSMTGWRLGWMVVPEDLADPIERLQQNFYICAPTLSQYAAIAAFESHEELQGHVDRCRAHRDLLVEGLAAAGITELAVPDGAFYLYADVSHLGDDSMALCRRWLDELDLCATPGVDFDPVRGHRFVRFSYAGRRDDLVTAAERLADWTP
ncbi:MAG: aminotransferase class I/II-fold pyridoxal phosphate-dependent enzyme [Ilumatobacteraceae bacterium]